MIYVYMLYYDTIIINSIKILKKYSCDFFPNDSFMTKKLFSLNKL